MHLKRIELHGYKSFATKTAFGIDPGITAVVGPNGSGKSNITDGVRWVLGESVGKTLRARRLEDVIFSGSEKRAPAGMAEVRITLDNEGGWLPLEFSEVVVTRRTHRDGESEYLINNSRVRRRDVQELFQRSGLGPSSYAILGQGMVAEVLSMRPEERRGLIEEVADVRRHRVKMAEARRKREQTHENLARARLIVEEIAPRVRTLERQAKRVLQHVELVAELERALRHWYRREWWRLRDEASAHRAGHDQAHAERERAAQVLAQAETALAAWEGELRDARATLERVDGERRRRGDHVRRLEQEQSIARERQVLLSERAGELQRDLATLEHDTASLQVERVEPGENAGLEESQAGAREAVEAAQRALAAVDAEQDRLRQEGVAAEARRAQLRGEEEEAQRRLLRLGEERGRLQGETGPREQQLQALHTRLSESETAATVAAAAATDAGQEADDARQRREQSAQRYYAAAARLRGLEVGRADEERRLASARDRLALLQELQAEIEGARQGLRALFGGGAQPRPGEATGIPGVVGLLRHRIRAPEGLERAIEAALDGYLDAVIFERTAAAIEVIGALIDEQAGRIVALPLDDIQERSPLVIQPERGIIGVASALVKCDERDRSLVGTLLGRTVVTEDVEAARRFIKRGLGSAVTRDGCLLRPLGSIVGGVAGAGGAFMREAELRALPEEIAELEQLLDDAAQVEERRAELQALEQAVVQAEQESEAAAAARAQAQDAAAARQADVVRLQGEISWLEAEVERAERREAELAAEEAQWLRERDAHARACGEAETAGPAAAAVTEAESRRAAAARRLGDVSARLSALEGEGEALRSTYQAHQAAIDRVRSQRRSRSDQLQGVEQELMRLVEAIAQRDGDLQEAQRVHATVSDAAGPEAESLRRLTVDERERRGVLQRSQHGLLESERALVSAEAAVSTGDVALARLQEQIRADGLRADERDEIVPAAVAAMPTFLARSAGEGGRRDEGDRGTVTAAIETIAARPSAGGAAVPEPVDDDPALSDEELRAQIDQLRGRLRWLGNVNPDAADEYHEVRERHDHLSDQITDLEEAEQRMLTVEADLASLINDRFQASFAKVDGHFRRYFRTMFQGGQAQLRLSDEADWESSGVEIVAQPPGKRLQDLAMLSGGERSLTAIALMFAMLEVNPAPFCILDEVDAALDEANVDRFVAALRDLAQSTQFVVITHNRCTIEQADSIYGITMGEDSVSRVLSVRLADLDLDD